MVGLLLSRLRTRLLPNSVINIEHYAIYDIILRDISDCHFAGSRFRHHDIGWREYMDSNVGGQGRLMAHYDGHHGLVIARHISSASRQEQYTPVTLRHSITYGHKVLTHGR